MKFGKQLQLGIYEPWRDYYIQYSKLKRIIKRRQFVMEKLAEKSRGGGVGYGMENTNISLTKYLQLAPLRSNESQAAPQVPEPTQSSSAGIADENTPLTASNQQRDSYVVSPMGSLVADGSEREDSIEFFPVILEEINKINNFFVGKMAELRIALEEITNSRNNAYVSHHTRTDPNYLTKLRDIYISLAALRSYCDLCKTGFYKIIKKYDKTLGENTLDTWMKTVERQPFTVTTEAVHLMEVVTGLVSRDKLIEWERFATEQQNRSSDDLFPAVRLYGLIISMVVFTVSLFVPLIVPDDGCANRCMSLLLLTICLWVTEAIPYYATAILIPAFVTLLGVLKDPVDPSVPMSVDLAAKYVTNHIFNKTTLLLLAGYTISTAFSRCQLELRIASVLQHYFGNRPTLFILAVMFLGLFLSMWISNHTAPILCATIILPIVRDLPTDSRFSKTLLLGLAYACNFGGMMTPIASLQNVLAVSYLEESGVEVSFGRWIYVSLPFCVVLTVLAWLFLLIVMKPYDITAIPIIVYERGSVFGKRNIAVVVLSLSIITIFATFSLYKGVFGNIGVVAAVFMGIMFGSGILSEVDFNSLSWHTLFLVGGGNILGHAVASSGLLGYISDEITHALPLGHPWVALLVLLTFTMIVATFVSHTVASLIIMPIISTIGMDLGLPEVTVIGAAYAVSAAMALPFSSFPNVNSVLIVDDFQRPYLAVKDFVMTGLPLSILTLFLIVTLGFFLISALIVNDS